MSKGKIFGAAILGTLAGAISGLLLAPKTGKEIRKLIKNKSKDIGDKTKKWIEEGEEKVVNTLKKK